jgi:Flp pilus assembly protein TadB
MKAEASSVQRHWRRFRIAAWSLAGLSCILILLEAFFWPGVAMLAAAVAVFITWQEWARRSQARLTAMARDLEARRRDA